MSGCLRDVVVAIAAAGALLVAAPSASGKPPPPADLQVEGGEETWHPKRSFDLVWTNPDPVDEPIAAVHYRVRDPGGALVAGPQRIDWAAESIVRLEVPRQPGAYTAEIWLEDAAGQVGAPAAAKLRFDDARPGPIEPLDVPTWIAQTAFPLRIRLSHPSGPPPVSGIRGYAVSIAQTPDRRPCAAANRCTEAETDLRGGAADDSYLIADLPEGTSYLEAVAISGSGMTSVVAGHAVLRVDETSPAVSLIGAPTGWTNRPVQLTAVATDAGSGMVPDGRGAAPFTAIAIDGGVPAIASGASVTASAISEGVHRVAYYARDLAGNVDDGARSNGILNSAPPTSAVVRIDHRPPRISLVRAPDPRDPELIRARVEDSMSGPNPARGWIGIRRLGSGDRFERLPVVPFASGELRAHWDSDAYGAGQYEFRAVGYDAAGNATATSRGTDGTPMVLSSPLKAVTTLRAGFGLREQAGRTVSFGTGTLLSGHMTAGAGATPGPAQVRIVERFAAGADPGLRVSTVTTDRRGAFAIRLAPGPSREVSAVFDGTSTLARTWTSVLRLGVRAGVRLRASSAVARVGGRPLTFRGQVAAPHGAIPPRGKSVQLQFRLPGIPWSEFRTIQTDRRGRFRYAYRFSDDDSRGARFQFRASVPAQAGWPYEPGSSRPVTVLGR